MSTDADTRPHVIDEARVDAFTALDLIQHMAGDIADCLDEVSVSMRYIARRCSEIKYPEHREAVAQ